jgi:hypothetical protein
VYVLRTGIIFGALLDARGVRPADETTILSKAAGERCAGARGLGRQIGGGEHQRAPSLAHVPFDVVGEQAQKKVRARTRSSVR